MSLTVVHPKPAAALLPMGWLDWQRDDGDYVGGDYRISLIEPHRWDVRLDGRHLFFDFRLSGALQRADHHYRDRLRRRDLIVWSTVLVVSVVAMAALELFAATNALWSIPLLALALYGAISAAVRIFAAATRSRFDPYRRRAPWEPRAWWQR